MVLEKYLMLKLIFLIDKVFVYKSLNVIENGNM